MALRSLFLQVITSWQVIAITVALVLYLSLVFYVAKVRRVRGPDYRKPKKPKKAPPLTPAPEAGSLDQTDDEELGITD